MFFRSVKKRSERKTFLFVFEPSFHDRCSRVFLLSVNEPQKSWSRHQFPFPSFVAVFLPWSILRTLWNYLSGKSDLFEEGQKRTTNNVIQGLESCVIDNAWLRSVWFVNQVIRMLNILRKNDHERRYAIFGSCVRISRWICFAHLFANELFKYKQTHGRK